MLPEVDACIVSRFFRIPGKPVAHNYGLRWLIHGPLWGIVACSFRLLGFPGTSTQRIHRGGGGTLGHRSAWAYLRLVWTHHHSVIACLSR